MDFANLPSNVMVVILLRLDSKDILRMKSVCKSWHGLVSPNQAFWREKFEMEFGELEGGDVDFEEEYKIEYGWRFKEPSVVHLRGHFEMLRDLKVVGSMLVSGTCGNSQIWDLHCMGQVHVFDVKRVVPSVALGNEKVFLGLANGHIQVYSLPSKELCYTWRAHNTWVQVLSISDNCLITGDSDSLKTWDASNFGLLCDYEARGWKVLHVDGKEAIYGLSDEMQVHVYHAEDGLLYTLEIGITFYALCANRKYIFVGCENGSTQVWCRETRQNMLTLIGDRSWVKGVGCDERRLLSASRMGGLKIWNLETFTCIQNIKLDVGMVQCMAYGNGRAVVGNKAGNLCVLEFRV